MKVGSRGGRVPIKGSGKPDRKKDHNLTERPGALTVSALSGAGRFLSHKCVRELAPGRDPHVCPGLLLKLLSAVTARPLWLMLHRLLATLVRFVKHGKCLLPQLKPTSSG
jgi:hypothetical protein